MYNNTIIYIFNRILSVAIFLFILYLIFTNFGTFLIIVAIIVSIIAFLIYNFKKKLKQSNFNNFEFRFDSSQFQNGKFDFRDFQNFNNSNFQGFSNVASFDEVSKAKEFFGFTQTPTKEEVKKRYKELAKKYHPDLNNGEDTKMKELNHYRDILMNIVE